MSGLGLAPLGIKEIFMGGRYPRISDFSFSAMKVSVTTEADGGSGKKHGMF